VQITFKADVQYNKHCLLINTDQWKFVRQCVKCQFQARQTFYMVHRAEG